MSRRGFPHRQEEGEEAAVAPGHYSRQRPSEEAARRRVPTCIRTSRGIVVEDDSSDDDVDEEESTTPTAREARIPERLPCPPAPRKRRPSLACGGQDQSEHKELFLCPPDLEAVFARRKQPAQVR